MSQAEQSQVRGTGPLVLVSADAGEALRGQVRDGSRPCPDYLRLEERAGARLLDRGAAARLRPRPVSGAVHAAAALPAVRGAGSVLSDSEHVGLPLALAMLASGTTTPHVVVGHHLTTPVKTALLRGSPALRRIDRFLVHSSSQQRALTAALRLSPDRVRVVPYGVDTDFWRPVAGVPGRRLVVAAGREHRDYAALARACADLDTRVFVTDSSGHSPRARRQEPLAWPANVERGRVSFPELRDLYARARVVAVPLVATDFPAGITAALEAMSMGRAVVVTGTEGLAGVVQDGVTGVVVAPGDVAGLRTAVGDLLADPVRAARLGAAARAAVLEHWSLDTYVGRLGAHLAELAGTAVPA